MGFEPMRWVFEHSQADGIGRLVMLTIAWFADNDDWTAWPNADQLAEKAHLSRATIFRYVPNLTTLGELGVTPGRGRGHPTRYTINPKRSQPETLNGDLRSQPETHSDEKRSQKGLRIAEKRSHWCDQNSQELRTNTNAPKTSQPATNYKTSQPETLSKPQPQNVSHCPTCQNPTIDCTCGHPLVGPTAIRDVLNGLRREDPPGEVR